MSETISIRKVFSSGNIVVPKNDKFIFLGNEMDFINKIEKAICSNENSTQFLLIENRKQNLFLVNLMISVIIKAIYRKRKLSDFEVKIYEDFIKKECDYKLSFSAAENLFYKDFVVDNLKVIAKTITELKVKEIHDKFYKYFSSKEILDLSIWLKFLTEKVLCDNKTYLLNKKIDELKPYQLKQIEQKKLFNLIVYGNKNKIEELTKSFEIIIYSCMKEFNLDNHSIDEVFQDVRKSLEIHIQNRSNSKGNENFFFKFIVFTIQGKIRKFLLDK